MKFEIKEVKDKNVWEDFLLECEEKTFLQSWNWGEFNRMMGNKIWRFGIYERENLVAVAIIIKISAKRAVFLSCPHGPIIKSETSNQRLEILEILIKEITKIAKEEKAVFLRLSPIWEKNDENIKIFKKAGFSPAPILLHPDLSWELDITPPEENILMQMRKTTRYLIKQAQKKADIEIKLSKNREDLKLFDSLYQETYKRHHFVPYSSDYLRKEFEAFEGDDQIAIFLGRYQQELVAAGLIIFWQKLTFYHHGATSLKYPKIPVAYLLQWEIIKEAKKRGCQRYNFWGIAPEKASLNHPWQGFTLFKKGFGGYKKEYVKTQDLPFLKRYWLVYLFEKLRKIKRGL